MYGMVVFLHVLGAFGFVLAHGMSMLVSFRPRTERWAASASSPSSGMLAKPF